MAVARRGTGFAGLAVLIAVALLGCSPGGSMPGACADQTPRPYDNALDGTATVVEVTEAGGRLLTFDFQASNWTEAERQAPVLAGAITGLPPELPIAAGDRLPLHVTLHLEQICATTPREARPPTWSYRSATRP